MLTDFGIARAVEEARLETTAERLTATGVGIGTLGYMAPEQLAGEKGLDARADVYALAVVGYEMLAGKPPFSRPTMQALVAAHMSEPPPPLSEVAPDVPPVISGIIEKALAKSPDDRYRTAAEFRDALDIQMTAAFQVVPRKPKVPRWAIIGGATVAGLAICAAAFFATRSPKLDPDYVVVLPFNVQGADPTLSQGMIDVLQPIAGGLGEDRCADAVSALVEAVIACGRGERSRPGAADGRGARDLWDRARGCRTTRSRSPRRCST